MHSRTPQYIADLNILNETHYAYTHYYLHKHPSYIYMERYKT